MNIFIKTMTEDDDKEVVAQACTSIVDIIKDYGYMAIEPCKFELSWLHFLLVKYLSDARLKFYSRLELITFLDHRYVSAG